MKTLIIAVSALRLLHSVVKAAGLEKDFRNPPVAARPYVWWH